MTPVRAAQKRRDEQSIEAKRLLLGAFDQREGYIDHALWWSDPHLLRGLGTWLGGLFEDDTPQLVVAPASRGTLLGAVTALALGVGFVEIRKAVPDAEDHDPWLEAHTPMDYLGRNLPLYLRARSVPNGTRVLFVDDWVDTGGQLLAARELVARAGGAWIGAAVIVDGLSTAQHLRRECGIRSLLRARDLPD